MAHDESAPPLNMNNLRDIFIQPGGYKAICLTCILLTGCVFTMQAQLETDYAVHANIIYRITKYIDWPEDKKSGDFVIGIIGESPLHDNLKSFVANKTVVSQKIVIRKYPSSSKTFDCQMLFICEMESSHIKKISTRTSGIPVLLISEDEGFARKWSCINFMIAEDRLKLEINKSNIEQRHLNIATELLELGTVVK